LGLCVAGAPRKGKSITMENFTGIIGRADTVVSTENIATALGSGNLPVFGTPFMVALMEKAASVSILPYLEEGQSSVGTLLNISHSSATPVGMRVWAESVVTEVQGRRVVFKVKAFDEAGQIGEGEHERFIIDAERFMKKCIGKAKADD